MITNKNILSIMLFFLTLGFVFLPGRSLAFSFDVVAKVAVTSFDALIKAMPDKVTFDSVKGGWELYRVDGKESILLNSINPDISIEFDAEPFIKAGLDVAKLPVGQYVYDKSTGKITIPFTYGQRKLSAGAKKSALNTFKEMVRTRRDIIGYHQEGDHYRITLSNGNMLEWAKDLTSNNKDLVFIINPKPLIDAGVDTNKIKEWTFAKLPIMDRDGKPVLYDKFLKAFNVK